MHSYEETAYVPLLLPSLQCKSGQRYYMDLVRLNSSRTFENGCAVPWTLDSLDEKVSLNVPTTVLPHAFLQFPYNDPFQSPRKMKAVARIGRYQALLLSRCEHILSRLRECNQVLS